MPEDSDSVDSSQQYSPFRPFINSRYRRESQELDAPYPVSDRDGVMSALRSLQGKIRQIELEKSATEDSLKNLSTATSQFKDYWESERDGNQAVQQVVTRHTHELESQLSSAENRCQLLERQLEQMRRLVQEAERDREKLDTQQQQQQYHHHQQQQQRRHVVELPTRVDDCSLKLKSIEREQVRLSASQNAAVDKLRELEARVAVPLDVDSHVRSASTEWRPRAPLSKPKSKASSPPTCQKPASRRKSPHPSTSPHYLFSMVDIPFVAGKSAAPSHRLGANIQELFHLLKSHSGACENEALRPDHRSRTRSRSRTRASAKPRTEKVDSGVVGSTSDSSGSGLEVEIEELILQLEDEFGRLSREHQELTRKLVDARNTQEKLDLEEELDRLVEQIESKGNQIKRLRKHKEHMIEQKRKHRRKAAAVISSSDETEPAPVKSRNPSASRAKTSSKPATPDHHRAVRLMRDMKTLKTHLRRDDICWS